MSRKRNKLPLACPLCAAPMFGYWQTGPRDKCYACGCVWDMYAVEGWTGEPRTSELRDTPVLLYRCEAQQIDLALEAR